MNFLCINMIQMEIWLKIVFTILLIYFLIDLSAFMMKRGIVIEEVDYNGDGAIFKKNVYKYHYDQNGNWTKRTKFNVLNENTKEPDSIIEIKIGYIN